MHFSWVAWSAWGLGPSEVPEFSFVPIKGGLFTIPEFSLVATSKIVLPLAAVAGKGYL